MLNYSTVLRIYNKKYTYTDIENIWACKAGSKTMTTVGINYTCKQIKGNQWELVTWPVHK